MDYIFFQNIILSLVLGLIIGLQREMSLKYTNQPRDFGGVRTFGLISLAGFLSSGLSIFISEFVIIAFICIAILVTSAYVLNNLKSSKKGITTELSALIAFFIGVMINFLPTTYALFVAILVVFVLNLKDKLQEYENKISRTDLNQAVLFMIMTFVILPIVPNKPIDPWGLFNLYQIWLMTILIAGISFFGYICNRFLGSQKGLGLTGFFGGLVSSTAIAYNMAMQVKSANQLSKNFAIAVMLASSLMLFRAYIEIYFVNPKLAINFLYPMLFASFSGFCYITFLYFKMPKQNFTNEIALKNPFELNEALLIGVIFGATIAMITVAKQFFGDSGIYMISFFSGLLDVDAPILSISSLANTTLEFKIATNAILITIFANSLTKFFIVFFIGGWDFAKNILIFYILTICIFSILVGIGI